MFGYKKQNKELKERIDKLDLSVWKLENPCPYKIGQVLSEDKKTKSIISEIYHDWFICTNNIKWYRRWNYKSITIDK